MFFGCTKEYENHEVVVLGHAGMGINSFYPWNSYESIFKSLALDSDGTEMDVRMTKDSVFVLFHSNVLENETNKIGDITNLNWSEIEGARYLRPYLTNYRIAKLENVLKAFEGRPDKILDLEIKPFLGNDRTQYFKTFNSNLLKLLNQYDVADNLMIEFNQKLPIELFKAENTTIPIMVFTEYEIALQRAITYDCEGIVVSLDELDEAKIKEIHDAGKKVATFNVQSISDHKKALDLGVDIIQTDNLNYLIDLVK